MQGVVPGDRARGAAGREDRRRQRSLRIHQVVDPRGEFHLVLSIMLVVLVILAFLRNARSTIITALILPTSVIGTFAAMYLLGYSLNNLSLMAIILAVGFVVDDAIVVLENITRHMEMGKDRMQAALDGSQGDRVYRAVDDDLALGGIHPDPVHGRAAGAVVPRIRRHGRRGGADLRRGLALDDADDVQPAAEAHAQPWPRVPVLRKGVRRVAGFLRNDAALDHAAPGPDARRVGRVPGVDRASCTSWFRRASSRGRTRASSSATRGHRKASPSRSSSGGNAWPQRSSRSTPMWRRSCRRPGRARAAYWETTSAD